MRKSRLSQYKQTRLIELFVAGTTARTVASLVNVNTKTAIYYFHRQRELIYRYDDTVEKLTGKIEVDESYFGGARNGYRGRGSAGKVPVLDLLKRNGKVYMGMIPDAKTKTLMPIIRYKVKPGSILYSDCRRAYNELDVSGFEHYRINYSRLFANKYNHIIGIENLWNQAKRHFTQV